MKSICVSTSQRMRPAIGSLLPKPGVEPRAEQVEPPLESCAIALSVQLGGDEREDHAGQLAVELAGRGGRESRPAERREQLVADAAGVLACEGTGEERHRPRIREQQLPRGAGEAREAVPP